MKNGNPSEHAYGEGGFPQRGRTLMKRHFDLAYPLQTVRWDGTCITAVSDAELEHSLDVFQSVSIGKVMLAGYHVEEKAAFDMDAESRRIGAILRARGVKATQHHSVCPSFALAGTSQAPVREHLFRAIEFTANLGAENMVMHAGRPFGHHDSVRTFCGLYLAEVERIGLDALLRDLTGQGKPLMGIPHSIPAVRGLLCVVPMAMYRQRLYHGRTTACRGYVRRRQR